MTAARSKWNSRLKKITNAPDTRPTGNKLTKDEWVIAVVKRAVGGGSRDGLLHRDDIISEVFLKLLDAGGFDWGEEQITDFCRAAARKIAGLHFYRVERTVSELSRVDGEADEMFEIIYKNHVQQPMQELSFMANQSLALLDSLPDKHRLALEVLCDGGNPVEIAEEQGITLAHAITLIREARRYIQLVDPSNE